MDHNRPKNFYPLLACLFLQGISGISGGVALITDPTGGIMKFPVNWLQGSPFDSFLIPGIILLIVIGIYPFVVIYALLSRFSWAKLAAELAGDVLIIWILSELIIVGYRDRPPLQIIYGLLGVIILILATLLPHHWIKEEAKKSI